MSFLLCQHSLLTFPKQASRADSFADQFCAYLLTGATPTYAIQIHHQKHFLPIFKEVFERTENTILEEDVTPANIPKMRRSRYLLL